MNYRPLRSHLPKVLKPKLNSIFDEEHGGSKRKTITGLFISLMFFCLLIGAFYALGGFSNFTKLTKGDRERVLDRVPLDQVPPSL
jgi:hypothetical protein